jgi:tuftelin-interacting protein 11
MEKPSQPKMTPDVGAWEKHTKGIGLKLLQKMGFSGRLGANENGVSRAIEVVVRPNNTGLGFGDIKEAAQLKINKKIEAEWRGLDYVDEDEEKKKSSVERLAEAKGWKKNKGGGASVAKVSAAEFISKYMNEGSTSFKQQPQVIIDMRHKDARVITDMSEIGTDSYADEIPANAKPKLGQELLYNINLLASTEEINVTRDSKALGRTVSKIKTLTEDSAQLEKGLAQEAQRLTRLQKILLILSRVDEKLNPKPDSAADGTNGTPKKAEISLASICGVVRTLHQTFPEEFQIFGLINLLPNLISRVAVAESWQPFVDYAHLCDLHDDLTPLVDYFQAADELQLARQVRKAFSDVVELRYLPIVRRAVASGWDVYTEAEACVKLFEALQLVLPATTFETTVEMFLLPRLTVAVNNWRPSVSSDVPAAHVWLHPWLPLLTTKLSTLYPEIRRKFGSLLSNFDVVLDSVAVVGILLPWVTVFDSTSFENLLVRSALPKLATTLREVEINPAQQDIVPIETILSWCRLMPALPPLHVTCLWVGEFFPHWLRVLHTWLLSPDTDFAEVSDWYTGWKGLFPEALLQEEKVAECFTLALEMMQTSLSVEEGDGHNAAENPMNAFDAVLQRMEKDNYFTLIEQYKTLQRAQRRLDALQAESDSQYANRLFHAGISGAGGAGHSLSGAKGPTSSYKQITFKEVVETFAMRNNVEFVPKLGRMFEGKQLWQFGRSLCYLDQNVVFVSTAAKEGKRGGGDSGVGGGQDHASRQELYGWSPVALEDLLQISK